MVTIKDIKAIIYDTNESERIIVKNFLSYNDKEIVPFENELELSEIIEKMKKEGHDSKEVIILKKFNGRGFQKCPGSNNMICCNYLLLNTCFDCFYNCTYCFLNSYLNSYGIIQFTNLDTITDEIEEHAVDKNMIYRIGTGEFTDSLMMDDVTNITENIIKNTSHLKNVMIEFKTKSDNIDHLLNISEKGNSVLAWSLNTDKNIELYEEGTATLIERIDAAVKAEKAGYYLAFHFDPIIMYDGYIKEYLSVVDYLFSKVNPDNVVWISLGCFRHTPSFKDIVQEKFPKERLTLEEMFPGLDGKMRYLKHKRVEIFSRMAKKIKSYSSNPFVYLCMEASDVWKEVFNLDYKENEDLENDLSEHLKNRFIMKK